VERADLLLPQFLPFEGLAIEGLGGAAAGGIAAAGKTLGLEGALKELKAEVSQKLSEARAASVKQWLVANAKVNGANIATRGWGKTKPVAHNTKPDGSDDAEGRAKNRRVEIVIRKGA
jgi:hypothetical protein